MPAGLGAPVYGKLDTDLAAAMMSINAVKGVEIGDGMAAADEIVAHEFDVSHFSPDNPRILVYDENDVQIYAFPVAHILIGGAGCRLE